VRKFLMLAGVVAGLAIPAAALGVDINPGQINTGCVGDGVYHFVAPGGGATTKLILDMTGDGDVQAPGVLPDYFNRGTAHWWIDGSGSIVSASASPANRLVLSDAECDDKGEK
jgi:hypothetical protein